MQKKIPRNNQYISFLIALSNVVVHTDSCECCPTTLCDEFTTIVKSLIKEYLEIECDVPPQLLRCLQPNPAFRPTITELLNLKIFGHKREEIQPESLEFPELLNFSYNAPGCQMTRREILHEMCYLKQLTVDIPKQHTEILGGVFGEMAKYPIFSIERFVSISRDLSTEEVHNDFCIYSLDVNDVITASEEVDCEIDKYITTDDTTIDQPTSDKLPFIVNILAQQITSSSKSDCIRYHRIHHAYFRFLARYAARNPLTVGTVVRRVERVVQSYIPEFLRLPVWMLFLGIDVNAAYDHYKTRSKDVPQCIGSDDIDEETRVIVEDVKRAFSTVPIIANEKTRAMLTRVLFSFYKSGEEYCQGIHSVCAVFLSLSFNEAICSECLHKFEADFVRQYSPENFRIYFIRLCQLLSFHGPRVSPVMSAKIIENSTAIRWFLPLLSLSMKLNSLYQLWDWVLQSPKFAKFMYFLLAYILSCENLILEFTDPFELILYFNKVEFGSTTTNEQCISQFKSLIQTSPISYTENHISPSHPSRSVSYTTLADQAIDESSMVLVPLLDQSDLTFTMYNTTSLYIDMRPEAPYSPLAPKSLRVIFHTTEEVVSDVSTSLNSFETYPAFVVLISDWKSEEERSAVYLEMMLVADGLVKGGFSHVCMSAVAFQDLDRQFFNNGEKPTEQEDDVV
ncbi:Rab GTPase activating protein [Entamoeba marina]